MRGVLYKDLVGMFWAVHAIMEQSKEIPEPDRADWQREQLDKSLLFRGEKYCLEKLEIYMGLPERPASEMLYRSFHTIVDDKVWTIVNTNLALRFFSKVVHEGGLKTQYFRRFLSNTRADYMLHVIDKYYKEDQQLRERMGLSAGEENAS